MTVELPDLQAQLDQALTRIERLEKCLESQGRNDRAWRYLIARPHPWRQQLYVKGRNMTVGQLVSTVRANRLTPQQASEDMELPVEAIEEALLYYDQNRGLIQLEAAEERRSLAEAGVPLEPKDLRR